MSKEKRQAHLHWASDNEQQQPCFCNAVIYLDVTKIAASPELVAAIFGVQQPDEIVLKEEEGGKEIHLDTTDKNDGFPCWELEPEKHYKVHVLVSPGTPRNTVVPIRNIFQLLPGKTEDDKSERLQMLSNNFYAKIWNDDDTPAAFKDKFFSRSSSAEIQAFRQYDWLSEVFGGPSFRDDDARQKMLLPKVMAKHTSSRMTMEHAVTWLTLMTASIQEEFPDMPQLEEALGLYWLHFYAFFAYSDDERKEFRRLIK